MNYRRVWTDLHNAVGFVAECARLVLPFYEGGRQPVLVKAIELAEAYSRGDVMDIAVCKTAADDAGYVTRVHLSRVAEAAYCAVHTARAAAKITGARVIDSYVGQGALAAATVVPIDRINRVFVRWIARDLGVELKTEEQIRAGIAAILANESELIKTIAEAVAT